MAKLRLVFLRPFCERDRARLLTALNDFYEIIEPVAFTDDVLADAICGAQLALGSQISPPVLAAADQLRLLQTPGAGLDGLDLPALSRRGIMVANSHSNAPQVAEYTLTMLLAMVKRLCVNDRSLRNGIVPGVADSYPATLFERTIGLLGLGHVGRALLDLLVPWRVNALAAVRHPERHAELCKSKPWLSIVSVEDVLRQSDAVIVALPLTDYTRGLLGKEQLTLMHQDAFLINVGRAETIDQQALRQTLEAGCLAGVGLDVWHSPDTVAEAVDYARFERVVMTPHRAGADCESAPHLQGVIDNLLSFARTGQPLNTVDCLLGY